MNELSIFTPLVNPEYCLWFYYLSIVGFVMVLLSIFTLIGLTLKRKLTTVVFVQMIYAASLYLFFYFQNRILYSMCTKSINPL